MLIKPLAKTVLIPLVLTVAVSAADAGILKKILGSGNNTTTHNIKWWNERHYENT